MTTNPSIESTECQTRLCGLVRQHKQLILVFAILASFFAANSWTLTWQDFHSGSENLVVAAALETHRDGHWWIPTLHGRPRLVKPPLPTWITAMAISETTMRGLSSADAETRDSAYQHLAWEIRWPSLMTSCLLLLGTYYLGRCLAGHAVGLSAMVIAATSLEILRYGLNTTTDVHLAAWAAITNCCLAYLVLQRRWWIGCVAGGAALGLACMSKGPVVFFQTLLPIAVFAIYWRFQSPERTPASSAKRIWLPATLGLLITLAIALPWPISVILQYGNPAKIWVSEVTRFGATNHEADAWYAYARIAGANLLPWTPLLIAGLVMTFKKAYRQEPIILAMFLLLVPLLVMSVAPDKADRYFLPMLPAAAVLAGFAAMQLPRLRTTDIGANIVLWMQWIILLALSVLPIAGVHPQLNWYGLTTGIGLTILSMSIGLTSFILRNRFTPSCIVGGALIMLICLPIGLLGYASENHSVMRPLTKLILAAYPDPNVYFYRSEPHARAMVNELPIYLNRIVAHVQEPATLPQGSHPQVIVVEQRPGKPEPAIPGWHVFAKTPGERKSSWLALERNP